MNAISPRNSWILSICLLLGLAILGYLLRDAAITVKSMERTVTVKGLSEREVPANVATVREAMSNVIELAKQGVAVGGNPYQNQGSDPFLFTDLSSIKPEMIEDATRMPAWLRKNLRQTQIANSERLSRLSRANSLFRIVIRPRYT